MHFGHAFQCRATTQASLRAPTVLIYWSYPGLIFFVFTTASVKVERLQLHAKWAGLACPHGATVYTGNRRNLRTRTTQEDFVSSIEFCAIDAPFFHRHAKFLVYHVDQSIARDTLKDIFSKCRSGKLTIAQEKEIARTAL